MKTAWNSDATTSTRNGFGAAPLDTNPRRCRIYTTSTGYEIGGGRRESTRTGTIGPSQEATGTTPKPLGIIAFDGTAFSAPACRSPSLRGTRVDGDAETSGRSSVWQSPCLGSRMSLVRIQYCPLVINTIITLRIIDLPLVYFFIPKSLSYPNYLKMYCLLSPICHF